METTFSTPLAPHIVAKNGRVFLLNTPEEEAAINAGIAADPDTYSPTDEEFKNMRRGRPLGSGKKTMTHIRIDTVVLDHYKATGAGWQTRVNDDLRRMAGV